MKTDNYLALADYVDFDDKAKTRNTLIKWIWLEIILQVCYQAYPFVAKYFIKNRIFNDIFIIVFLLIFTMVAEHFSLTFKVFNERIKTRGAVKVMTIIYFVFLTLVALMNAISDSKIFKLSMHRTLAITLVALAAAICEEILCRGILFNICLVAFRKNKYNLLWTSILTSIFFSLMHLVNLVHQPLVSTIGQIIFAMALGLVLSYLRITSNGIIFGIIIHFLQDCSPQVASSNTGNSNIALVSAFYIPVIIFMLICIYLFERQFNKN